MTNSEINPGSPKKLYVVCTENCNLGCRYCYYNVGLETRKPKTEIDLEIRLKAIREMKGKFDEVLFTGGEALTDPHIFDLIAEAKKSGLNVGLMTNGVLLTTENCQKLVDLEVDTVSISLDSLDPGTNNKVRGKSTLVNNGISNMLAVRPEGMAMEIMMTVTSENITSIKPMTDYCVANNMNLWLDPVEVNPDNAKTQHLDLTKLKDEEKLLLKMEMNYWAEKMINPTLGPYTSACMQIISGDMPTNISCNMGTDNFVMDHDGEIYPCFSLKEQSLGNAYKGGLADFDKNVQLLNLQPVLQAAECVTLGCVCMTMVNEYGGQIN